MVTVAHLEMIGLQIHGLSIKLLRQMEIQMEMDGQIPTNQRVEPIQMTIHPFQLILTQMESVIL